MKQRCKAKTASGLACQANPGSSGYCWAHDPALAAKRAIAHKRGGENHPRLNAKPFPECDVKTAAGLLSLMEHVIKETWEIENSVSRNRTLGYLGQVQKGVLEVGELEERIAALEQTLAVGGKP